MSRDVAAGNKLRGERIELEWSADQAASIYGQAVKGTPITRKAYLRMEEGYLPKDPRRRWILARMLGIAPVVLGLSTPESAKYISYSPSKRAKPVDMSEYRAALLSYWKHGSSGSVQGALKDITRRIYALHDTIPYVSPNQKDPLKRLLCGYQMRGAEFVRELGYDAKALDHLNKAVILAHEEEFLDLEAAALYRRG